MKRRTFLKQTGLGLGSLLFAGGGLLRCDSVRKPNILFIFADDHCHAALSAFGSEVQTPNLDRLCEDGTSFTNAYNMGGWNGAVCIASRTMLNTGRTLWNAHQLDSKEQLDKETGAGRLWPQYFNANGYQTYFSGKWHVKTDVNELFGTVQHVRGGMPQDHIDWKNIEGKHLGYDRPIEGEPDDWSPYDKKMGGYWDGGKHWTEVLGDDAESFLQSSAGNDDPFFMYLAFNAPHDPRQSPKEFVERYPIEKIKVPESYLPMYPYKDAIGCGVRLRDERLAPLPRTEYAVKVNRQEYYAIITHMDEQIGRILDALGTAEKTNNTYIVFSADHGLAVGHHGLMGKQNMYEHSLKAPLVITGPDIPRNEKIDTPVYIQDIMPTTMELAGIEIPEHVEFKSLLPLVRKEKNKQYEAIYGAYLNLQRMVRVGDYKLIKYPKVPLTLLYNLKEDPEEMNNLADKEEFAGIVRNMDIKLKDLQKQTGDNLKFNN